MTMKKILYLTLLLLGVVACNKDDDFYKNRVNLDKIVDGSDIQKLIDKQRGPIDSEKLINQLSDCTLEIEKEASSLAGSVRSLGGRYYRFYEDGYFRIHTVNEKGVRYYTRDYNWKYDADNSTIITTDEYGNTSTAEVLYYDGDILLYYGSLGSDGAGSNGTVPRTHDKYRILRFFVKNVDDIFEGAVSYEILCNHYVDENDARLKFIEEKCAEGAEIDDELFLTHLKNDVFFIDYDSTNPTSGAAYGDIGVYPMHNSGILLWLDIATVSTTITHTTLKFIMMEDDVCRVCCRAESQELGYRERYWSYDAETNTIATKTFRELGDDKTSFAEVIYVDEQIAILKGSFFGVPYNKYYSWAYFYINFAEYDRQSALLEHSKRLTNDDF